MRRGDRKESVKLLNQIMISLFQDSEERFAEIRELMLELVLIIRRTVIECNVNRLKIPNAQQIWSEAFQLQNHEELTEWVRRITSYNVCYTKLLRGLFSRRSGPKLVARRVLSDRCQHLDRTVCRHVWVSRKLAWYGHRLL